MKEEIKKILEFCFEHSTARAFLIFSAVFVVFSIGYAREFVSVVFFTLFYAFIAYRIVVLRRAEIWGDYAVGDSLGALLYFVIDWFLFASWIIGTTLLLSGVSLLNLSSYCSFGISFGTASIAFISWVVLIFLRAFRQERRKTKETTTT